MFYEVFIISHQILYKHNVIIAHSILQFFEHIFFENHNLISLYVNSLSV